MTARKAGYDTAALLPTEMPRRVLMTTADRSTIFRLKKGTNGQVVNP